MIVEIPVRIMSVPNISEHWHKKAKRARDQRATTWYAMKAAKVPYVLPCTVTMTRVAPRSLDGDNLQAGIKACRDAIADWLDVNDNSPQVTWNYAQAKGKPKEYALRVEIT